MEGEVRGIVKKSANSQFLQFEFSVGHRISLVLIFLNDDGLIAFSSQGSFIIDRLQVHQLVSHAKTR